MMAQVQQIILLMKNILQSHDNALIASSQQSILAFSTQHPFQHILALIELLKLNQSQEIKSFTIVRLEKQLISLNKSNGWKVFSAEEQNLVRVSLFQLLKVQDNSVVKGQLASTIGQVAGQLMLSDIKNWPKFEEQVYAILGNADDESVLLGLKILNTFFNYSSHVFDKRGDDLFAIFKNAFNHSNNKIKQIAIKAYCGFLTTSNKKAQVKMQSLIIPFFQVTYHLVAKDNYNLEGLELISDLVEVFPRMLKNNFSQLSEMFNKVLVIKSLDSGPRKIIIETLITLAEKYPEIFKKSQDKIRELIELIFLQMVQNDPGISEEWKKPPEGFSEDLENGDDFQATNFGTLSIDRLISAIGEEEMIPLLSITIQKMLQVEDWRYKFASLMALSEVGDHVDEVEDLKGIIQMLISHLSHENPMIRFAAIHSIGQTAESQRPEFQQLYGLQTFLKLAPLLQDPVPRVVSHAAAALSNVIEGMQYEDISVHVQQLMSLLLTLATTGISLVKTSVLNTISSISMTAQQNFIPFFQKTSQILFSIIDTHKGRNYKQLKGNVIETLTSIAHSIGKQPFKAAAPHLIQYLISIQENDLEDVDPQKQYLLEGWQKLCTVFGKDLEPYLPRILPGLFNVVEKIVQKNIKHSQIQNILTEHNTDESKINTFETQEAESSIAMLNIFIEQIKEHYAPYVQRTSAILLAIIKSQINQNVKLQALIGVPLIVNIVKSKDMASGIAYAKNFLSILIGVCHTTQDADLMSEQVECMEEIFKCFGGNKFLEANELTEFSKQVVQILVNSKERRNANDKERQSIEDIENDEIQYYSQQLSSEEEVQVSLSNLIGEILKTHKEMNLGLVQYVLETELPRVFVEGATSKMVKFGIFLVDDMVDHLGYEIMKTQWSDFGKVFVKYLLDKNCSVRQAACYGLGSFAEKTPGDVFSPMLKISLDLLVEAMNIPKNEKDTDKTHKACTDNTISAIGKIIKSHGRFIDPRPYLTVWLQSLPLKVDEVEAITQHELLTQIILNDQTLLIPDQSDQSIKTLTKILKVFGDIIKTKVSKKQINENIKLCLNKFKTQPLFYGNSDRLWSNLTQKQAKKLTDLIKS